MSPLGRNRVSKYLYIRSTRGSNGVLVRTMWIGLPHVPIKMSPGESPANHRANSKCSPEVRNRQECAVATLALTVGVHPLGRFRRRRNRNRHLKGTR